MTLMRTNVDLPIFIRFILWLVGPLMLYGSIISVRQLLNPPKMFCADRQGVTIYFESGRKRYTDKGVFLPWKIVCDLTLKKLILPGYYQNRRSSWVIFCTLNEPAPFPVRAHSVEWSDSWNDLTICFDAFTGTVSKQELLDRLIPLWQAGLKNSGIRGME
jgi:hypothetical protein